MPKAGINGIDIYYELKGEGPQLLYISGTGGDLRVKPTIFDYPLSKHFTILTYDQRGMGQTSKPDTPYTMRDYAEDAHELTRHVGWKNCFVIGVSFGGMVAQELAIRHPETVTRLVLACTSSGGRGGASYPLHQLPSDPEQRAWKRLQILDTRQNEEWKKTHPEQYQAALRQRMTPSPYEKEPGFATGSRRQLEARAGHDTYDRLPRLNMPTYICGGKYDGISPPKNLEAMHGQIPGSRLEYFEGGHLFLGQDPSAFRRIIAFLLDKEV